MFTHVNTICRVVGASNSFIKCHLFVLDNANIINMFAWSFFRVKGLVVD